MRRAFRTNRVRLKHLNRSGAWPSGNPRWYYRPKGTKAVPLPDKPHDHPEFLAAYAAAAGLSAPPVPKHGQGTIGEGVALFLASSAYTAKSEATRAVWRRMLDDIRKRYGAALSKDLQPKHIVADLSGRGPHPANNRLKVWRALCRWWKKVHMIPTNPAASVQRMEAPKSDGHIPWGADDLARFRAHWPNGSLQRLAFEVLHWTGARMSDAVRLNDGMVRDGWLTYQQDKTRGVVTIPLYVDPPYYADPAGHVFLMAALKAKSGPLFMPTEFGTQRSKKAASSWFAGAARAAGLVDRTGHGLRKTRLITMTEREATTHQLSAWCGQDSLKEVERYTKLANRRRVLEAGMTSNKKSEKFQLGEIYE